MDDRNAYLVEGSEPDPLWPVPPAYVSPWSFESLAQRINTIPPVDCCRGLVDLLLNVAREADLQLAKALLDNWTLEGLLKETQDATETVVRE